METRFNLPSKFTKAEFKKIVRVIGDTVGDEVQYTVHVQTSRDEDNVRWVEAGEFLFVALEHLLSDPHYLDQVMVSFEKRKGIIEKVKNEEVSILKRNSAI